MLTQLGNFGQFLCFILDNVQLKKLEEAVSVLRCKLNGKAQILLRCFEIIMSIALQVRHHKSCSLTPDLARLWNFLQC